MARSVCEGLSWLFTRSAQEFESERNRMLMEFDMHHRNLLNRVEHVAGRNHRPSPADLGALRDGPSSYANAMTMSVRSIWTLACTALVTLLHARPCSHEVEESNHGFQETCRLHRFRRLGTTKDPLCLVQRTQAREQAWLLALHRGTVSMIAQPSKPSGPPRLRTREARPIRSLYPCHIMDRRFG